jgi:hypothetical protein
VLGSWLLVRWVGMGGAGRTELTRLTDRELKNGLSGSGPVAVEGFLRKFRLELNEPGGMTCEEGLLGMSELRRKTVENLRLVINEPGVGWSTQKSGGGRNLHENLTAATLTGINDGPSHKQSWPKAR